MLNISPVIIVCIEISRFITFAYIFFTRCLVHCTPSASARGVSESNTSEKTI